MSLKPVESKVMKGANQESGLPTRDSVIQIDRSSSRLEYHWKTSQVGEMTHCHRKCSYFAERNAVLRSKTPKLVPKMLYLVVVYRVTINDVRWQKGPCNEATNYRRVSAHVVLDQTRRNTSFTLDKQFAALETLSFSQEMREIFRSSPASVSEVILLNLLNGTKLNRWVPLLLEVSQCSQHEKFLGGVLWGRNTWFHAEV